MAFWFFFFFFATISCLHFITWIIIQIFDSFFFQFATETSNREKRAEVREIFVETFSNCSNSNSNLKMAVSNWNELSNENYCWINMTTDWGTWYVGNFVFIGLHDSSSNEEDFYVWIAGQLMTSEAILTAKDWGQRLYLLWFVSQEVVYLAPTNVTSHVHLVKIYSCCCQKI